MPPVGERLQRSRVTALKRVHGPNLWSVVADASPSREIRYPPVMSFAHAWAGPLVLLLVSLVSRGAHAGPATQTPPASPAHPVWESNKAHVPTGSRFGGPPAHRNLPRRPTRPHEVLRSRHLPRRDESDLNDVPEGPSFITSETAAHIAEVADGQAVRLRRRARAEQAYQDAQTLWRAGEHIRAVEQLDMAVELAPDWVAPLELRADIFAGLARRHHPSETFLSAQAADLEAVLAFAPSEGVARRVTDLRRQIDAARGIEARRRRMTRPALILGSVSAALIGGGVLLACFYPSTDIDALGQRRYVYGGVVMAALGVALAPPAIALGVLAGRQNRHDDRTREFNAHTGREQPVLVVAPIYVPGGGGSVVQLRF